MLRLFIIFLLFPMICDAQESGFKFEWNQFDLAFSGYYQSDSHSHSGLLGWRPTLFEFGRLELTPRFAMSAHKRNQNNSIFELIHLDLTLAYNFYNNLKIEPYVGIDEWIGEESNLEYGLAFSGNLNLFKKTNNGFFGRLLSHIDEKFSEVVDC